MILAFLLAQAEEPPKAHRFTTTGFRAAMPAGPPAATARFALVEDPNGPTLGELTLRGQGAWHSFGFSVETVVTAGASPYWSSAGFGNTQLDVRGLFGRGSTHALGLQVVLPSGNRQGARGPVSWWGTVPSATVPTGSGALAYEGAVDRWVWHLHAGLFVRTPILAFGPDLDLTVATVQPLVGCWSVVGEFEAQFSESPVHLRALARGNLARGWTVDAGLAAPLPAMFRDPTLQILGRVDHRW